MTRLRATARKSPATHCTPNYSQRLVAVGFYFIFFPPLECSRCCAYYYHCFRIQVVLALRATNNRQRLVPFGVQSLLRLALLGTRVYLRAVCVCVCVCVCLCV